MSPPPLPLEQHFFVSNNNNMINNKLDSGRIDLLLSLALHTPATLSLPPATPASSAQHDYGHEQQPSLTLSLLFPSATQQQNLSSKYCDDISSVFTSFDNVKRERDDEELDATDPNNINTDHYLCEDDDDDVSMSGDSVRGRSSTCRKKKKLRLNKKQSGLLEQSFKLHTTLNHKQKEALARQLNLRPRQVEVWFQNRRARTKLKQTEVDCEFLKKCCERLAEENEKLHKELQHLKSSVLKKQQQPFYTHHLQPITSSWLSNTSANHMQYCPSCHHHHQHHQQQQQQQQVPPNNSSKKHFILDPFTKAAS